MPPSKGNQTYTIKQKHNALDDATLGITVITLVVLGIYTTINYYLYQATVSTNQANQRALIFVTSMELRKIRERFTLFSQFHAGHDEFTYRDLGQLQHLPALIPPRSTFTTEIPVRPDHIDDAIKYKTSLYVWGTINYIDIFKQPHLTAFCAKYEGAEKTADSNSITYNFEQCATHNCTDSDCPKRWGLDDSIDCENLDKTPPTPALAPVPK